MVDKGVMESGSLKKAGNNTHRRSKGSHKLLVLYPVFTFKECQHLFFYSVHSEWLPPFFFSLQDTQSDFPVVTGAG